MSRTKIYIFAFVKAIIIVSEISCWNDASEFYGLRKIDFRRRFGPVKMLNHATNGTRNKDSKVNEVPQKTDNEINEMEEAIDTKLNYDEGSGIVHKDSVTPISMTDDPIARKEKGLPPERPKKVVEDHSKRNCWMDVNANQHFKLMDGLDDRYSSVRTKYQEAAEKDNFSKDMLDMMIKTRGIAHREIHGAKGDPSAIPAGINLGGYGMLRLDDSILFFHRMKLRNNTHFDVKSLENDLANMALTAQLSLNDLHILGAYERASTLSDPVQLFYTPTYGEAEFLLKNVEYNMEGRYRMLRDKLAIELVISDIKVNDILLTYRNKKKDYKSVVLERKNIDEFLDKLKINLDKWLKDYFNDYLMYFGLVGAKANARFITYNQEKTIALNEYTDKMLEKLSGRIRELKLCAVRLPEFSVTAVNGMQLKLKHGVLRGLETLHRRSLATGKRENDLRKVNAIVGFSSLKGTYQYEAVFNTGVPPINGMLVVTADELIAHFSLTLTEDPKSGDLRFDSIQQLKPESLTLEGPANRIIGNLKTLLERHVFTFISNAIIHNIIMLRTLTKCEPLLFSIHRTCEEEDEEAENERKPSDSSTNDDKIEKQLPFDNNEANLENDAPEMNANTSNDNKKLEEGGAQNNEQSTASNRGVDVQIKIIGNGDNANDNSETNRDADTNNDKASSENANENRSSNDDKIEKQLISDNNDANLGNDTPEINPNTSNDNQKLEEGGAQNNKESTASNKGVDVEIKIIGNGDNANDNSKTNRNVDINNDKGSNENANENTEKNRDLDTSNDKGDNENDKSTLSNADDEINSSSANNKKNKKGNVEIVIIPKSEYNTDKNSETNRNLDTNNDGESIDEE